MVVLCVHAAKHVWVQLSWLCDIAELSQSVDWVVVQDHAQRLGIERIVAVTFILAARLLGTRMPQPVQERIRNDRAAEGLADKILPIVAQRTEYHTESMAYFRLMMDVRERWRDRLRFVGRLAFTPSVGEWELGPIARPSVPVVSRRASDAIGAKIDFIADRVLETITVSHSSLPAPYPPADLVRRLAYIQTFSCWPWLPPKYRPAWLPRAADSAAMSCPHARR